LNGIGVSCRYGTEGNGVSVENIKLQNLTVEAHNAFEMRMSASDSHPPFTEHRYMKDIDFDTVNAYCDRGSYLIGFDNSTVSNISFRNMRMYFSGEDKGNGRYRCNWIDVRDKKAAFYIRRTGDVVFENVTFEHAESSDFVCDIMSENCQNLQLIRTNAAHKNL